jgi:hypothetical protein
MLHERTLQDVPLTHDRQLSLALLKVTVATFARGAIALRAK